MTNIMTFQSKYGPISVEMDEDTARAASIAERGDHADGNPWVAKGVKSLTSRDNEVHIETDERFENAIGSLRAYAGSLLDVVNGIDLTPSEVSVEVGLKLTGSAGFIIAKAEGEAEMKVALKWEPGKAPESAESSSGDQQAPTA